MNTETRMAVLEAIYRFAEKNFSGRAAELWAVNGIAKPDNEPLFEWLGFYTNDEEFENAVAAFVNALDFVENTKEV